MDPQTVFEREAAFPIGLRGRPTGIVGQLAVGRRGDRGARLIARQHHGAAIQPQAPAENGAFGLPAGLDQRRDRGETRLHIGRAEALHADGRDRQIGVGVLSHGVELRNQPPVVGGVEPSIEKHIADRVFVENQLVRRPLGGEPPLPFGAELKDAAAQNEAAGGSRAESVATGGEVLIIGVAAANIDEPRVEALAPFEVEERIYPRVDLRGDGEVRRRAQHLIVRLLIAWPPPAGEGDDRQEQAGFTRGRRVRTGDDGDVEHRQAEDFDDRVVEGQGLATLVLDDAARLDRPGRMGLAVVGAYRAGGEDDMIKRGHVGVFAPGGGGGDLHITLQAGGETLGEAGAHGFVEGQGIGELRRAIGVEHLHLAAGDHDAALGVIVDMLGAQNAVLVARFDAPVGDDVMGVFVLGDDIRLEIEAAARETVVFGRLGRLHGRSRRRSSAAAHDLRLGRRGAQQRDREDRRDVETGQIRRNLAPCLHA